MADKKNENEVQMVKLYTYNKKEQKVVGKVSVVPFDVIANRIKKVTGGVITFSLIAGIGLGVIATNAVNKHIDQKEIADQLAYQARYEQAYNDAINDDNLYRIEHEVRYGQSYWGIAEHLYDDGNLQKECVDIMQSLNGRTSILNVGTVLEMEVHESVLEKEGYTTNYDILKPEIGVRDMMEWTNKFLIGYENMKKETNFEVSPERNAIEQQVDVLWEELTNMYVYGESLTDDDAKEENFAAMYPKCVNLITFIRGGLSYYIDGKDNTQGVLIGDFDALRAYKMTEENMTPEAYAEYVSNNRTR